MEQLQHGSNVEAFEAAKQLIDSKDPGLMVQLTTVLHSGAQPHSREAAAYALSWHDDSQAVAPLMECATDANELDSVRGQAIEGIAMHLRKDPAVPELHVEAESLMISFLQSSSQTLRFWACFGLGTIRSERAIPLLREISQKDEDIYPGWWFVWEEAEDALEWIAGRPGADRVPVHLRKTITAESDS